MTYLQLWPISNASGEDARIHTNLRLFSYLCLIYLPLNVILKFTLSLSVTALQTAHVKVIIYDDPEVLLGV